MRRQTVPCTSSSDRKCLVGDSEETRATGTQLVMMRLIADADKRQSTRRLRLYRRNARGPTAATLHLVVYETGNRRYERRTPHGRVVSRDIRDADEQQHRINVRHETKQRTVDVLVLCISTAGPCS